MKLGDFLNKEELTKTSDFNVTWSETPDQAILK